MTWQVNLPFKDDIEKEQLLAKLSISNTLGILEKDTELISFFESSSDLENFTHLLRDFSFYSEKVKDRINWNVKWQKFHKLIKIKPFIVFAPFLRKKVSISPPYKYKIIINPSFAFGTGSHPTTKMCIKYLANYVKKRDIILDVGTGSGILAIVSEKLGAEHVLAIDIDEIALKEAEKNIKRNRCKNIFLRETISSDIDIKFDIIVCNILLNDILKLKDLFSKVIKKGGKLILSGLLREQKKEVLLFYSTEFKYINSMRMRDKNFDWIALSFEKL